MAIQGRRRPRMAAVEPTWTYLWRSLDCHNAHSPAPEAEPEIILNIKKSPVK